MVKQGQKYIITTDDWFYAPDGKKYKAAWGTVKIESDAILGIKTNKGSTNWYAIVGSEERHIVIAGCQIHYAAACEEPPSNIAKEHLYSAEKGIIEFRRPSEIYIAE